MRRKYETLDEYLDDLDAIKEKIAEKTSGMTTEEVLAYFAGAERRLCELTEQKLRTRRCKRKVSAKR
jgi:predicted transcriptional regulator